MMTRRQLYDGAQRRFEAHDRRWRLIQEVQRGSMERMRDWAFAYLRWKHAADTHVEPPRLTLVGNLVDQLGKAHRIG
jgi:hypothetical protein